MNGEELFKLSKDTFNQFTNETESARIYALLYQQKQLSGVRIDIFLVIILSIYISFPSINPEISRKDRLFRVTVLLALFERLISIIMTVRSSHFFHHFKAFSFQIISPFDPKTP